MILCLDAPPKINTSDLQFLKVMTILHKLKIFAATAISICSSCIHSLYKNQNNNVFHLNALETPVCYIHSTIIISICPTYKHCEDSSLEKWAFLCGPVCSGCLALCCTWCWQDRRWGKSVIGWFSLLSPGLKYHMGQVTKLWLSCYLVLLSIDSKTR